MSSPDPTSDRAIDHEVEDPSGLVAKLRALGRGAEDTSDSAGDGFRTRVFGSPTYFRLWTAQAITSMGDWLGFLAIVVLATRIGGGASSSSSVGLVMAARIIPGFFFSAAAGVLIDRMDRKQVMVVTTMVRAGVVAVLPFVDSVWGLVFASLILELATLMFSPAKEATVPNLVPTERLASANSLSLAAAYGTFPIASLLFALLAQFAEWLQNFSALEGMNRATIAFYVNAAFYLIAALIISRLAIPKGHIRVHEDEPAIDLGDAFREIKEGWHYAFINPVVRAVNLGLATGLIGGGMLVPLGAAFAEDVLGAGASGFGVFVTALGFGVGVGVIAISARQATLNKERAFVLSVFGTGVVLIIGASMWTLELAALSVFVMGIFAGTVYVLGFTLLHENVDDELRGRVFAGLYTLVRLCLLLSMALGPFLAGLLDGISDSLFDRKINVGITISVPGVRLTLWFAGAIMIVASVLAAKSLRPNAWLPGSWGRRSAAGTDGEVGDEADGETGGVVPGDGDSATPASETPSAGSDVAGGEVLSRTESESLR